MLQQHKKQTKEAGKDKRKKLCKIKSELKSYILYPTPVCASVCKNCFRTVVQFQKCLKKKKFGLAEVEKLPYKKRLIKADGKIFF